MAVLFIGAARVSTKERGRPLTLTSERAAAAAAVLGASVVVPAHYDGWAHFSEGLERVVEAFEEAGLSDVIGPRTRAAGLSIVRSQGPAGCSAGSFGERRADADPSHVLVPAAPALAASQAAAAACGVPELGQGR